jgi:6-phosphogluconate dehydrogenase
VKEFVGLIKQPRAIMFVPAGKPVDTAIESLPPYDTFLSMVEIHTLPILTADLQHYRPKDSLFGMGISGGEKEHDLVLAYAWR